MSKTIYGLICDDEEIASDLVYSALVTSFQKYGYELKLDKYLDPTQLAKIDVSKYQVAFLDIDMPKMDGIELGTSLKDLSQHMDIIFVSNCEDRVFDAFVVNPFGFVRKSSFLKDVDSVVKLYIAALKKKEDSPRFEVSYNGEIYNINIHDIVYIESVRDCQYIHLPKQEIKLYQNMNKLEEIFSPYGFLRVHQGYIVNYRYIAKIGKESLTLLDDTILPISRRKRKEVFASYIRLSRLADNVVSLLENEE